MALAIRLDHQEGKPVAAAPGLVARRGPEIEPGRLAAAVAFQQRFYHTRLVTSA